jgi:hypothetical protein
MPTQRPRPHPARRRFERIVEDEPDENDAPSPNAPSPTAHLASPPTMSPLAEANAVAPQDEVASVATAKKPQRAAQATAAERLAMLERLDQSPIGDTSGLAAIVRAVFPTFDVAVESDRKQIDSKVRWLKYGAGAPLLTDPVARAKAIAELKAAVEAAEAKARQKAAKEEKAREKAAAEQRAAALAAASEAMAQQATQRRKPPAHARSPAAAAATLLRARAGVGATTGAATVTATARKRYRAYRVELFGGPHGQQETAAGGLTTMPVVQYSTERSEVDGLESVRSRVWLVGAESTVFHSDFRLHSDIRVVSRELGAFWERSLSMSLSDFRLQSWARFAIRCSGADA